MSGYVSACEFAAHDHPVFPVRGKMPLTGKGGFRNASTDPAQLLRWHGLYPNAGWAVALGERLAVVDVDVKNGADVQQVIPLVSGPMVETGQANGSGRGLHIYCLGPAPTADTELEGVEVRGERAYVVLPGSPHESGVTYRWVGEARPWIDGDLVALPPAFRPVRRRTPPVEGERITAGRRDVALFSLAGVMRRHGMTEGEVGAALLKVNQDRCDPPLSRKQVLEKARGITRYPPEEAAEPEDWLTGTPMDPAAVNPNPPLLLPGFPYLHGGMAAVISGPTGGGRSSLVQAGAYDAAVAGLRVAYLGGEVTEGEFNDRAALLAELRGDEITAELRAELARARWLDLADVITAAWKDPARWIRDAAVAYDVVIIDPLGDMLEALGLEDKASDYRRFYLKLIEPLRSAGLAVVMLDNVGHAEDAQQRPSGTSAKMHKADLLFSCAAVEDPSALRITATKVRAQRARVRKGDTWLFAESTQDVEPQGRQALVTPPRRSRREGARTARQDAILGALSDKPMSVREVAKAAGLVHGEPVPKSSAYDALVDLEIAGRAAQRDGGWVGVRVSETPKEPGHSDTPPKNAIYGYEEGDR